MSSKLYYYFLGSKKVDGGNWGLTHNKDLANRLDANYRLASIQDVSDIMCIKNKRFKRIIEVQEGVFILSQILHVDKFNPEFSYWTKDYIKTWN